MTRPAPQSSDGSSFPISTDPTYPSNHHGRPLTVSEIDDLTIKAAREPGDLAEESLHPYTRRMKALGWKNPNTETAPEPHVPEEKVESAPEPKAPEPQPEPDPHSQPDPESVLRYYEGVQTTVASEDVAKQSPPKQPPPKHVRTKKGNAATTYLRSLQSEPRYTQITFEATKGVIRLNRFAKALKGIGDVITICLAYTDGSGDFWVKARQLREDLGMPNVKRNRKRVNQYIDALRMGVDFGEGPIPAFVEYQGKKWVNGRHKTFTIKRWRDDFLTALDHLGRITIEDESLSAAERGRLSKGVRKQRGMGVSS